LQAALRLVNTSDSARLRWETVETLPDQITTFRDRVTAAVVRMLDLELTDQARQVLRAADNQDSTAYGYYLDGRGYLQRSDRAENLDKAIFAFRKALAKDDKYALAYAGVAEGFLKKYSRSKNSSDLDNADANAIRALDLNDELEGVHVTMGRIQSARGRYDDAEEHFLRVQRINPVDPEAYQGLAQAYEASGCLNSAEDAYKNAIAVRRNDWVSYYLLGKFYFTHQLYGQAEVRFREAEQLVPSNVLTVNALGATYLEMGRAAQAISMFENSLKLDESARAHSNLGMAYHLAGKYAEAAREHERATLLAPQNEVYWGNLGHAERWDPDLSAKAPEAYHRAIQLGEASLDINPHDSRLHARLATYWAGLGDPKMSLTEIRLALAGARLDGYVQYRASLVYEQAGDRATALRALERALDLGYSLAEIDNAGPLKALRESDAYHHLREPRTVARALFNTQACRK
jgi:tetratricopeptide (TPR) repeat protein